jgi:hypothetical protein
MRINDDVVVNTHHLIDHFANKPYELNQIFGYGIYGVEPIRSQDDKFHVSEQDYPSARYDDYIEGKKKSIVVNHGKSFHENIFSFIFAKKICAIFFVK